MPVPPRQAGKAGSKFLSKTLAENARQFRSVLGHSQDDVAERMRALGHEWSRQTVSDVERNVRNVTVDELLGLALVLGTPISELLDPRGVLRAFPENVDPGNPDLPYIEQHADDPTPIEIPGTHGLGIPPAVLRALVESRVKLMLGPEGIAVAEVEGHERDFAEMMAEFRRQGEREMQRLKERLKQQGESR